MRRDWFAYRQWTFTADMNADGAVTISDVGLWFKWLYFYPGDFAVASLGPGALGRFMEMTPASSFGGIGSGAVSFFAWLIAFSAVVGFFEQLEKPAATRE